MHMYARYTQLLVLVHTVIVLIHAKIADSAVRTGCNGFRGCNAQNKAEHVAYEVHAMGRIRLSTV